MFYNIGMATANSTPMMATTTNSSISVNPARGGKNLLFAFVAFISVCFLGWGTLALRAAAFRSRRARRVHPAFSIRLLFGHVSGLPSLARGLARYSQPATLSSQVA